MQMHLHYMHILSILLDVQAQKKSRYATLCYLSYVYICMLVQFSVFSFQLLAVSFAISL